METVFDHKVTPNEWKQISGLDKELYLSVVDEDSANFDLALLYYLRGKKAKAKTYADKIKDEKYKIDLWRTLTHP